MQDEVEEYLRMADEYHRKGVELFSKKDHPDAAEKIWASIKTATLALTERYLGRTAPQKASHGEILSLWVSSEQELAKRKLKRKLNIL